MKCMEWDIYECMHNWLTGEISNARELDDKLELLSVLKYVYK